MKTIDWLARAGRPLRGQACIPGDKSISHRAVMLGAIAEGRTEIRGFLESADTHATEAALRSMGVAIEAPAPGHRIVHGVGLRGLKPAKQALDCGNAGTAMRLLAGLLAGQPFSSQLTGDASLSRRPMRRVIDPLTLMGAQIGSAAGGFPPLVIAGGRSLRGIEYRLPIASAQVKSCLLLAGLYAQGETAIGEPQPTRDHSERMLRAFGQPVANKAGWIRLRPNRLLQATGIRIPGDISSAAFLIVAALLIPGSELCLADVGINPRRTGILTALHAMGAEIRIENEREWGHEPVADLRVSYSPLAGIELDASSIADLIDELPILFIAAACARGVTRIRGAAELRVKESDRLATMVEGLRVLGIVVEELPDGAVIHGGRLGAGTVDARGDHRIAMSFAVAGQAAAGPITLRDCANVATSFPEFASLTKRLGFDLHQIGGQASA